MVAHRPRLTVIFDNLPFPEQNYCTWLRTTIKTLPPHSARKRFFWRNKMFTEIYRGERTRNGCTITVSGNPLPPRADLINFSQGVFDWGFCGAEAKQLALAILAHHCGGDEQRALNNYDEFKSLVIAHIPCNTWLMDREYIEQILRTIEHQSRKVQAIENQIPLYNKTQITSFKFKAWIETNTKTGG